MGKDTSTLEWQLGYYVGEYIVYNFLPDLSIDRYGEPGKRTIIVGKEETEEYEKISKAWHDAIDAAPASAKDKWGNVDYKKVGVSEWKAYIEYRTMLKYKYLPAFLKCHVPQVDITTEQRAEFIKGLESALWNSDMSHYWCPPDVVIVNDDIFWLTKILLPLHHDGENKNDEHTIQK